MRLSGKAGASYRHPTDAAFQIDFLTPLHRGGLAARDARAPHLGIGAWLDRRARPRPARRGAKRAKVKTRS